MSYFVSFYSCVSFSPFSIAITSLGDKKVSAFRTFVRFVLIWICRFPLPLGVWEGLRFVIVALSGLFSYPFYQCNINHIYNICLGILVLYILTSPFHIRNVYVKFSPCCQYERDIYIFCKTF